MTDPETFIAYLRQHKAPQDAPEAWFKWTVYKEAQGHAMEALDDYAAASGSLELAQLAVIYLMSRISPTAHVHACQAALAIDNKPALKTALEDLRGQMLRRRRSRRWK